MPSWLAGVQPELPPHKPDCMPRNRYEDREDLEQECEYLEPEPSQGHVIIKATPKEGQDAELNQPEPETDNAYEQIKGMEELE